MVSIPRSKTLSAKSTASNLLVSLAQRQIFPLSNLERFRLIFLLWKNLFKITSIVLKNSDGTYSLSSNAKSQKHCWRLPKNSWLAWVIFVSHITCIKSPTTKFCFFNLPFDRGCFEKFLKCGNSKKRWVMAGSTKKKKTHLTEKPTWKSNLVNKTKPMKQRKLLLQKCPFLRYTLTLSRGIWIMWIQNYN